MSSIHFYSFRLSFFKLYFQNNFHFKVVDDYIIAIRLNFFDCLHLLTVNKIFIGIFMCLNVVVDVLVETMIKIFGN